MDLLKKALRFALACAAIFAGCVLASAVLGLILEAALWTGIPQKMTGSYVNWSNNLPFTETTDLWIQSTGLNPGVLGYLLALVVLALFGIFRSRK